MKLVVDLYKHLAGVAKTIHMFVGYMFIMVLAMWSVVYLLGYSVDKAQVDLKPFVDSDLLVYIWIFAFIILSINGLVWLIGDIRKGITKARNPSLSAEEKSKSLFWWLLKN